MDPETAMFLTAQRMAHDQTGHMKNCGCSECTIQAQLIRADKPLKRTIAFLYAKGAHHFHGKEARAVLEELATGHAQADGNGSQSADPISTLPKSVVRSNERTGNPQQP